MEGPFCDLSVNPPGTIVPCPSWVINCQNGATCSIINGSFINCECPTRFSGVFCDTAAICENVDCGNGKCIPSSDGTDFTCQCNPGWFGLFCNTQSCLPNPCENEHICFTTSLGLPKCLCK